MFVIMLHKNIKELIQNRIIFFLYIKNIVSRAETKSNKLNSNQICTLNSTNSIPDIKTHARKDCRNHFCKFNNLYV